jgi:glycosyltransferase involved in cell wall biosynthesis
MARLLFVKSRRASFIELDERLLAERHDVHEIYQPGHYPQPGRLLREVVWADVIVGWWASWHTFAPFTLAWLMRKPSLLIIGGFDTAAEPELGYGYQLGGIRAVMSRFTMRRAGALMTNSEYSRREIERNIGFPRERVRLLYHGVADADPAGGPLTGRVGSNLHPNLPHLGLDPERPLVLTVGIVDRINLDRKGLRVFAEAAKLVPEAQFVIAGKIAGGAGGELEAIGAPNLALAGWVTDEELASLYGAARVYVQASRHEGFGVAVAEAMLARCVPVVTAAGALPEVVGDTGVVLEDGSAQSVAAGIRQALAAPTAGDARARVLERFSVQQRRDGLLALVEELVGPAS